MGRFSNFAETEMETEVATEPQQSRFSQFADEASDIQPEQSGGRFAKFAKPVDQQEEGSFLSKLGNVVPAVAIAQKGKVVGGAIQSFAESSIGSLAQFPRYMQEAQRTLSEDVPTMQMDFLEGFGVEVPESLKKAHQAYFEQSVKAMNPLSGAIEGMKTADTVPAIKKFNDEIEKFGVERIKKSEAIREGLTEHKEGVFQLLKEKRYGDLSDKMADLAIMESPQLVAQAVIAYLSGGASLLYMGGSAATRKYGSLADEGLSPIKRVGNATGTGLVEYYSEKFGTGKILDDFMSGKLMTSGFKAVKKVVIDAMRGSASEGLASVGENALDMIVGMDASLGDGVAESMILGAMMDGGTSVAAQMGTSSKTKRYKDGLLAAGATEQEADALIAEAQSVKNVEEQRVVDGKITEILNRSKGQTDNDMKQSVLRSDAEAIFEQETISDKDRAEVFDIIDNVNAVEASLIEAELIVKDVESLVAEFPFLTEIGKITSETDSAKISKIAEGLEKFYGYKPTNKQIVDAFYGKEAVATDAATEQVKGKEADNGSERKQTVGAEQEGVAGQEPVTADQTDEGAKPKDAGAAEAGVSDQVVTKLAKSPEEISDQAKKTSAEEYPNFTPREICEGHCLEWAQEFASRTEDGLVRDVDLWELRGEKDLPYHVWVEANGKFYDAETPSGVDTWKDLPFYKRHNNKGAIDRLVERDFPTQPKKKPQQIEQKQPTQEGKVEGEPVKGEKTGEQAKEEKKEAKKPVKERVKPEKKQNLVGISRKANNIVREAFDASELTPPEVRTHESVLQEAIDGDYAANADSRADEVLSVKHGPGSRPAPLTDVEVAAALVRKAEISNEMDTLIKMRDGFEKSKDKDGWLRTNDKLDEAKRRMERLTRAVDISMTENARGMAMMARFIDKKSYALADVLNNAKTVKRDGLTKDEERKFENLTSELKAVQELRKEKLTAVTEAEAKVLEEFANEALNEMMSSIKTRRTKEQIKKKREAIKKKLTQLGYQMNDITGITVGAADAIKDLAINYIHDGATTLHEIKELFLNQTDGFTEHDLYSALGGRVKGGAKKARTEAQEILSEVKKQSALLAEIDDFAEGIFDPVKPAAKTSKEVKELRHKLKLLKASVVNTERSDQRVESILDTITKIENMINLRYRPIKVVNKKTQRLVDAEKKLTVANKELKAQDRLALLEEVLRTDAPSKKAHIERSETSQQLEEFRAQIAGIQQLIAEKKAPIKEREAYEAREKAIDAQIDVLVKEVEGFIRFIDSAPNKNKKTEFEGKKKTRSELMEDIADQDTLVELFDILNNRRTPDGVKAKKSEDRRGYKAMIQNIRQTIQQEEWHKEWKQTRDEAAKNIRSKEAIADMERRIEQNDFEGFVTPKQVAMIKSAELRQNKITEHRLKTEINERIRALRPKTWTDWASEIWQIPRSAKLTLDLGHIWRQGGFLLSNPTKTNAIKFTAMSIKNFNKENADGWDVWILDHPNYEQAKKDGLRIIEKGEKLQGVERLLDDDLLEKIPKIGKLVEASARTQITSLNVLRMSWYSGYLERNPDATDKERSEMVTALNVLTGYGQGKTVAQIAPFLDKLITSGRFTASRYQAPFLIPYALKKGNKALAKELAEDTAWFWGTRVSIMMLAAQLFPDVEWGKNPDEHTFGKLLVDLGNGKTRVYDPWAGLQAVARMGRKVGTGEDDPVTALAEDLAKKQSPQWRFAQALIHGKDWRGKPFNKKGPILNRAEGFVRGLTPISVEGIVDSAMESTGVLDMVLSTGADVLGIGSYVVDEPYSRVKRDSQWSKRNKD